MEPHIINGIKVNFEKMKVTTPGGKTITKIRAKVNGRIIAAGKTKNEALKGARRYLSTFNKKNNNKRKKKRMKNRPFKNLKSFVGVLENIQIGLVEKQK